MPDDLPLEVPRIGFVSALPLLDFAWGSWQYVTTGQMASASDGAILAWSVATTPKKTNNESLENMAMFPGLLDDESS